MAHRETFSGRIAWSNDDSTDWRSLRVLDGQRQEHSSSVYTMDMKHDTAWRYLLTSAIQSFALLLALVLSTPAQARSVGYKFNPAFKPIIPKLARVLIPIA